MLCQLTEPRNSDMPVAMNTLALGLVPRLLEKLLIIGWGSNIQDEPGSYSGAQENQTKKPHNNGNISKGNRSQQKELPIAKIGRI